MKPTFVLVHGSWHDGRCWRLVEPYLRTAGYPTLAPTLAGHASGDDKRAVTHADYVASVLAALDTAPAGPVALVGHSFAGSVISRVAELRPDRCARLVYCSAFVPRDGERVADSLPAHYLALFERLAAARADRAIRLPFAVFRQAFANTADDAAAAAIYRQLTAEPYGPIFEPLSLPRFDQLRIPTTYIICAQDRSLPPGSFHPGQSRRLAGARLIAIDGDHEVLLTAPARLARALLAAIGADPAGIRAVANA